MNRRCVILAVGLCLAAGSASWALDVIKTTTSRVPLRGEIQQMSPAEVELKTGLSPSRTIPVNEIVYISYDREPPGLNTARIALLGDRYEDALTSLSKVSPDEQKPPIQQDIEFYGALCRAKLALGGSGEIDAARKAMASFVTTRTGSYHWFRANEVVGDLYLATGAYQQAEKYYTQLAKAPWPDYKMRAGVAVGRARLAQGKTPQALQAFEYVLKTETTGELAQSQRLAATVGKARCLTADKKYDEAVKTVNGVISKTDSEQVELNARAYNALGTALMGSPDRDKEALMAFLHVDVIYFAVPETHAEALANLAVLWEKMNKTDRAARARRILEERYQNSPWAK